MVSIRNGISSLHRFSPVGGIGMDFVCSLGWLKVSTLESAAEVSTPKMRSTSIGPTKPSKALESEEMKISIRSGNQIPIADSPGRAGVFPADQIAGFIGTAVGYRIKSESRGV